MIDILVKDNYFENPDHIREIALSYKNYRIDNNSDNVGSGWRGQRTLPFRKLKDHYCPCCNQLVTSYSQTDEFIIEHSKKIFDICDEHFKFTKKCSEEMTITSFFHITTEETRKAYHDWQSRFHKDQNGSVAGVVYLSPEAPKHAGTSILDSENNQFINVENKYNRLVAYDGSKIHGVSDVFGDSKETGRMTLTFFIHTIGTSKYLN